MYPSVLEAFIPFSKDLEGETKFMYLDNRRLVTTGMGNLIDDADSTLTSAPASALNLPWIHPSTGQMATQDEINSAWLAVKNDDTLNPLNGGGQYARLTDLRLTQAGYDQLITSTRDRFIKVLEQYFPTMGTWPADAQLGVLAMAWGLGPAFSPHYPAFTRAVNGMVPNFLIAANESDWTNINANRDRAQKMLFRNAAAVMNSPDADLSVLVWPNSQLMGALRGKPSGSGFGKVLLAGLAVYGGVKAYEHRAAIGQYVKEKLAPKPTVAAPVTTPEPEKA